ncbi:ComEA family DNA-binding protein [Streptomyces sp. NPDC019937]|uniref:ComEA family DNA-binding protein n=1 Tax=Streptomyces sp. NPDC019937 TaxID=3154787 RepID=UPI0033E12AAD
MAKHETTVDEAMDEEATADGGGAEEKTATGGGQALRRRDRMLPALRERLPLWLQLRCGMELRTVAALAVALVAALAFAVHHFWSGRPQTVRAPEPEPARAAAPHSGPMSGPMSGPTTGARPAAGASGRSVVVDVTGKVRRPGLRHLPPGARVADAIEAAGGARPGADTSGLNRARPLVDGEQIVVGAPAHQAPAGPAPAGPAAAPAPGSGPGPGAPGAPGGGVLSLNSATAEQLDTLPGVGPVLARHILDYRTQHGGFRSIDELREVNGIGDRRFADLRPLVQP